MGNNTISIIIPVYKTEKFISYCLDSILSQTFSDFEVILVDDGSPDKAGEICDSYAARDNRLHVIHQLNSGVSHARNVGFSHAAGKYVIFVDSDDYLEPTMLEQMLFSLQKENADVAICAVNYVTEDHSLIRHDLQLDQLYAGEALIEAALILPPLIGGACYNKLYRKECIDSVRFQENLHYCEDLYYVFDSLCRCKSGIQISKPLYNIVEREGSVTRDGIKRIDSSYKIITGMDTLARHIFEVHPSLSSVASQKVLDFCLRYGREMKSIAAQNNIRIRTKLNSVKMIMCKYIIYSHLRKKLSKQLIHNYFLEMIRL